MKSIFTKTYKFRQKVGKHEKENYLTEIFAYCLQIDEILIEDFLKKCLIPVSFFEKDYKVETQKSYSQGRPDIVIQSSNTLILIECKVGSPLDIDQLKKYQQILVSDKRPNKHLIFLSKYHEVGLPKNVKTIRWHEVYSLSSLHELCKELKKYLKDENMNAIQRFDNADLKTLLKITDTVKKMNEILDYSKKYFQSKTKINLSKPNARGAQIIGTSSYKDYVWLTTPKDKNEYKYYINIGFSWGEGETVYFHLSWWLPKNNNEQDKVQQEFAKDLEQYVNRKADNFDGNLSNGYVQSIEGFFGEKNQLENLKEIMTNWIDGFIKFNKENQNKYLNK